MSHRPLPFLTNAVKEDDYKSLHIIIDNRGTYQHVTIEMKTSVFKETGTVADSLARALSEAFARYGLLVKVVPIRDEHRGGIRRLLGTMDRTLGALAEAGGDGVASLQI